MKILFVINTMGRGGAEMQVKALAMRMRALRHEVTVVSMIPFFDFEEEFHRVGIATASLGMVRGRARGWGPARFLRVLREHKPDVVHAHMFAAIALARLSRPFAPPHVLVCTSHTSFEDDPRRYQFYQLTNRLGDVWTNVCRRGIVDHERRGAVAPGSGTYMPNGIEIERFAFDEAARRGLREALDLGEDFTWLCVGAFHANGAKDQETLLRATAKLDPRTRVLFAGDGVRLEEMRSLAATLRLEGTRFLGMREDVPALLSAADAFVLSSRFEAMPMVLLEAAACRLPSVVTDVGGNAEIVDHDATGFVVRPRSPDDLASAMRRMVGMPVGERRAMGERARARIAAKFDIDALTREWLKLYQVTVDGRRRTSTVPRH